VVFERVARSALAKTSATTAKCRRISDAHFDAIDDLKRWRFEARRSETDEP